MKKLAEFATVALLAFGIWQLLKSISEYYPTEETEEPDFFDPFDSLDDITLD